MNTNKFILLPILFITFLFSIGIVYSQENSRPFYDTIFINNEIITIEDKCELTLKYNDVVKITGVSDIDKPVFVKFGDDTYSSKMDENGNWVVLFSIPYIDDGDYEIKGISEDEKEGELLCSVILSNPDSQEGETTKPNNTVLYIVLGIVSLSLITWVITFFIGKKKKK